MKSVVRILLALVGVAVATGLVTTISAQEKPEPARVRVMTMGGGSYLGVFISEVDADAASRLGLGEERGVLISEVSEEGPARAAGLEKDDVIVSWNGQRVEGTAQLRRLLSETPAGRTVSLGVVRGGSEREVSVELAERSSLARTAHAQVWTDESRERLREGLQRSREGLEDVRVRLREMPRGVRFMAFGGGRLGISVQSLGEQLGEYFGLGDRSGVLITSVRDESAAAKGGLKAGDVILAVDEEDIEDPGDVARAVREAEEGPMAIRILRDRQERTVAVDLPESDWEEWESKHGAVQGYSFDPDDFHFEQFDIEVDEGEPLHLFFEGPEAFEIDLPHFEIHMPDLAPMIESLEPMLDDLMESYEIPGETGSVSL
jgi:membrane-associated protease RseP (regulator of RpoE activity)